MPLYLRSIVLQIEHSRFVVTDKAPDLLSNLLSTIQECRLKRKPEPGELAQIKKVTVRCVEKRPVVEAVVGDEIKTFNVSKRDYQRLWDWHHSQQP